MKTCLPGFLNNRFDPIHQNCGRGAFVTTDVIQTDITKATFLPITAMRDSEFVPAAIAPETVHRVEHIEQRQITIEWQAIPSGRTHFFKRYVGLNQIDILHLLRLGVAHEGAHQPLP